MKRLSIILLVVGLVLIIGSNFFYRTDSNPIDSAGTRQVTETKGNNWAPKIPVFMGGVCVVLAAIFYFAAKSRPENNAHSA
ncbi:hypothetical protein [Mucilaginibacter sp. PAMB04168]|uniref:hypothetical protein n=1 Tax=Mucilaginibacter sp. PAMB04168 TaxID=3138567 RepID=UPI0031F6C91E